MSELEGPGQGRVQEKLYKGCEVTRVGCRSSCISMVKGPGKGAGGAVLVRLKDQGRVKEELYE